MLSLISYDALKINLSESITFTYDFYDTVAYSVNEAFRINITLSSYLFIVKLNTQIISDTFLILWRNIDTRCVNNCSSKK